MEGGGVLYDAPATIPDAQPVEPTPATPEPAGENVLPDPAAAPQASLNGSALLSVRVPTDARVFVNNIPTRSAGEARKYVSQDLAQGFRYTYEVRAEADVDGQTVVQTKTVHLRAGESADLAFVFAVPGETSLTLHVPHNAKVYLAGNETQGAGPVRTFRTTKLNPGATWADYGVRVVLDRDGQQLVETKMINLSAGEQRELTFDFDVDQVASAR